MVLEFGGRTAPVQKGPSTGAPTFFPSEKYVRIPPDVQRMAFSFFYLHFPHHLAAKNDQNHLVPIVCKWAHPVPYAHLSASIGSSWMHILRQPRCYCRRCTAQYRMCRNTTILSINNSHIQATRNSPCSFNFINIRQKWYTVVHEAVHHTHTPRTHT